MNCYEVFVGGVWVFNLFAVSLVEGLQNHTFGMQQVVIRDVHADLWYRRNHITAKIEPIQINHVIRFHPIVGNTTQDSILVVD